MRKPAPFIAASGLSLGDNAPQFTNQNLKYAVDFGTLLYLDGVPIEMMAFPKHLTAYD